MRLHRFYIKEIIGDRKEISVDSPELVHQMRKVFRIMNNETVILFDGSGFDYKGKQVDYVGTATAVFKIISREKSRFNVSRKLYLYSAIVKKDNFEFIVEKATELGVSDIIPVLAERSEKKALNEERLLKIAIEAAEQSGRGDIPRIHGIKDLKEAVESAKNMNSIVFHTDGNSFNRQNVTRDADLAVFIGPEGGWSPAEIETFHANKIAVLCLGPQILRAETAVVAALSQVVF